MMPDSPHPSRPDFWSQVLAIFQLAATALLNQFGSIFRRSPPGMRAATVPKGDRGWILPAVLLLPMLGVAVNSCYVGVHGLARHARQQFPPAKTEKIMQVRFLTYLEIESYAHDLRRGASPQDLEDSRSQLTQLIKVIRQLSPTEAEARVEKIVAHLEQFGMEGFSYAWHRGDRFVDIRTLSPEAKAWLGRVVTIVSGSLFVAVVLTSLSVRHKDLGAVDDQLAFYFCLPLTGREILSGQLTTAALVKPTAWILLLPLYSVLLWAMGHGWLALPAALVATLAFLLAIAGVEIAIEAAVRTSGSFRWKKNVQSMATIVGTIALCLALAVGLAADESAPWVDWLLAHTPSWWTALPGAFFLLPASGVLGLLAHLGILGAAAIGCGWVGWSVAARSLSRGLSSGNEREGARSTHVSVSPKPINLTRFEWLLLLRDHNLAMQVLVLPLLMAAFQIVLTPEMLADVSAAKITVFGFGCGIWAAITTAPHVILSESRSLWMIFSLPVSIADHFRRRIRVWRATGVALALLVVLLLVAWKGLPGECWWRVPAGLVGVWVVSLAVFALMLGHAKPPDMTRGERPPASISRFYGCMLIAGIVGGTLWHGTAWQIFVTLVLWWFWGFGMWQGVARRLECLLEPTHPTTPEVTLASAMTAILLFFAAQTIAAICLVPASPTQLPAAVLYSYLIGGLTALCFCGVVLANRQLPRREPAGTRLAITLPLCITACILCGALWLGLVHGVAPLRAMYDAANASAAVQIDKADWRLLVLVVAAAPLLEELVFRGFVLRIMHNVWSPRRAIFANALLFAIIHPAFSFPPVFVLGLAAAWLASRTQRLWPGMLLHAFYNAAISAMQLGE